MNKICIAGKNNIAVNVLQYISTHMPEIELCAIPDKNDDGRNGWQRSVKWFCQHNSIPIVSLEEIYDIPEILFISTEFYRIIKPERFKSSHLFNIHFSLLPKYKGMFTSILPILNDDFETGVTLHVIRKGIDTGEIIDQKPIIIDKNWNSQTLYSELISAGTEVVCRNIYLLLNGEYDAVPQTNTDSTYYGKGYIDYYCLFLNLNATANQIRNQVNAFAFRPYQLLKLNGCGLIGCKITGVVSSSSPGTLIGEDETKFILASIDYDIIIYKDVLKKLFKAIASHNNIEAKHLCAYKYIVNDKDEHGWTPLTVAIYNNNLEMAYFLINLGADEMVLNNNGTTLLMYSKDAGLRTGKWDCFRWLLRLGHSVHDRDYSGKTLVDYLDYSQLAIIPEDIRQAMNIISETSK